MRILLFLFAILTIINVQGQITSKKIEFPWADQYGICQDNRTLRVSDSTFVIYQRHGHSDLRMACYSVDLNKKWESRMFRPSEMTGVIPNMQLFKYGDKVVAFFIAEGKKSLHTYEIQTGKRKIITIENIDKYEIGCVPETEDIYLWKWNKFSKNDSKIEIQFIDENFKPKDVIYLDYIASEKYLSKKQLSKKPSTNRNRTEDLAENSSFIANKNGDFFRVINKASNEIEVIKYNKKGVRLGELTSQLSSSKNEYMFGRNYKIRLSGDNHVMVFGDDNNYFLTTFDFDKMQSNLVWNSIKDKNFFEEFYKIDVPSFSRRTPNVIPEHVKQNFFKPRLDEVVRSSKGNYILVFEERFYVNMFHWVYDVYFFSLNLNGRVEWKHRIGKFQDSYYCTSSYEFDIFGDEIRIITGEDIDIHDGMVFMRVVDATNGDMKEAISLTPNTDFNHFVRPFKLWFDEKRIALVISKTTLRKTFRELWMVELP